MSTQPQRRITPLRLFALAVFCGISASIVYIPQALLTDISTNFGVSHHTSGLIAASALLGYAVGILVLIPFGTRVRSSTQVTVQAIVLTVALLLAALSHSVIAATAAFFAVGVVGNLAQVIIPAANRMCAPGQRGATNSVLVGSLLVGLFGGRALASASTDWVGWRGTIVACALLVVLALPAALWALRRAVPPVGSALSHVSLMSAALKSARGNPVLLRAAFTQSLGLGAFNSVWAVMVLHLTAPPLSWSVTQAGMFGLVGLVAGLVTPMSGRLIDRYGARRMTGVFLVILSLSSGAIFLTHDIPVLFGLALFFSTWANQSALSGNQVQALSTSPEHSAQLNTAFSFIVFFIGGFGGLVGPLAFAMGGLSAVATVVTVLSLLALLVWRFVPVTRS
ncbi:MULTISPECIES: MFS transporter [unclassified Dietzia]|uniref:MFS transporter n=1 Tax=unclassified Dietzia TaxID=2617939 RepID=UPI0015FBD8BC|nr:MULTISPECIES: MFS transporter [unclassified Dietzia]MBB1040220.1 MFS transporter [Dietzia sp. Cai40]MBB1043319.1 MFS transporter [Dietzia sp. DQ11-44]MBB1053355.1 MFS transporter [Dietzia sp. B44]